MLKALEFLLVILEVLFFFNLLIVVHELGHFLAGRWRGAIIEEFGIWFGPPIWRKKFNGVWYSFGSVPLGGFVKLPQLGNRAIEGDADTENIPPLRPLDRIIVAVAGPLFSFLLAIVLACLVTVIGKPASQAGATTEIGTVIPGGPADKAGLKAGDKILAIDGKPVTRFDGPVHSVMWEIISSEGETIDFLIERGGVQQHITSGWAKEEGTSWARKPKRRVMIGPRYIPEVAGLEAKGAGEQAGLQVGDVVVKVNGAPVITLDQLDEIYKKAPSAPLDLTVERGQSTAELKLQPRELKPKEEVGLQTLGVEWGHFYLEHPSPWQQVTDSLRSMRNMLAAVTSAKSDVKLQDFSGPVGIMNLYRRILSSDEGWRMAIAFSVLFNVNLAVINMLPLPLLDGGHIMFGFIEMVRRKPGNAKVLEILETACLFTILGYVLYVTFFDVTDFFPHDHPAAATSAVSPAPAPATPAPPAQP
jgi:regulator of sigma E protease